MEDGLEVLKRELSIREVARLIERTARWVAPETFRLLPVWFPEHARTHHFYKKNWSEPQHNTNKTTKQKVHKQEGNRYANQALCYALGIAKSERPNWSCCHIWGRDDPTFQFTNSVISDHTYYSCVANMVLLPTPLKAFTDALPEIKTMLRVCATFLYGWTCDHPDVEKERVAANAFLDWESYPQSWPRPGSANRPLGTVSLTEKIEASARKRLARIAHDLEHAGNYYPSAVVRSVLEKWAINLPSDKQPI